MLRCMCTSECGVVLGSWRLCTSVLGCTRGVCAGLSERVPLDKEVLEYVGAGNRVVKLYGVGVFFDDACLDFGLALCRAG